MKDKKIELRFTEIQLRDLSYVIEGVASDIVFSQQWSQDRDEGEKWSALARNISHKVWCEYRRKHEPTNSITLVLPQCDWKMIRGVIKEKLQETRTGHTLFATEGIAKRKAWLKGKRVAAGFAKDMDALGPEKVLEQIEEMQREIEKDRERRLNKRQSMEILLKKLV